MGETNQESKANNNSINKIRVDFVGQYFTVLRCGQSLAAYFWRIISMRIGRKYSMPYDVMICLDFIAIFIEPLWFWYGGTNIALSVWVFVFRWHERIKTKANEFNSDARPMSCQVNGCGATLLWLVKYKFLKATWRVHCLWLVKEINQSIYYHFSLEHFKRFIDFHAVVPYEWHQAIIT